jgi:hypothetical protein
MDGWLLQALMKRWANVERLLISWCRLFVQSVAIQR